MSIFSKKQKIKISKEKVMIFSKDQWYEIEFKDIVKITVQPILSNFIIRSNFTFFFKTGEEITLYNLDGRESKYLKKKLGRDEIIRNLIEELPTIISRETALPDIILPNWLATLGIIIALLIFAGVVVYARAMTGFIG